MSFKKFIATAVVTAAAVTGSAVEAQPGAAALFDSLDQAGVTYSMGECEPHGITGTYGFFVPAKNHIHICDDVATTEEQQWETFRHEAVHAAQRCVDPSMQSSVMKHSWIDDNYSKSDWSFIKQAYDKSDWLIEIEAFTLMRYSNVHIAEVVNHACN